MKIAILVVDDDASVLALLTRFLARDQALEVDSACCAYEAMAMCLSKRYDAIICDIKLPDFDGPDLIKQLKGLRSCPDFVIFISGMVNSAPKTAFENTMFIAKPFNLTQITSALQPVKTKCLQNHISP